MYKFKPIREYVEKACGNYRMPPRFYREPIAYAYQLTTLAFSLYYLIRFGNAGNILRSKNITVMLLCGFISLKSICFTVSVALIFNRMTYYVALGLNGRWPLRPRPKWPTAIWGGPKWSSWPFQTNDIT